MAIYNEAKRFFLYNKTTGDFIGTSLIGTATPASRSIVSTFEEAYKSAAINDIVKLIDFDLPDGYAVYSINSYTFEETGAEIDQAYNETIARIKEFYGKED